MLVFVDGGTGRCETIKHKHGGVGAVAVSQNGTTTITGMGRFYHHETDVTNQRMELRAFMFLEEVLRICEKDQDEPLQVWSDSIYSIKTLFSDKDLPLKTNLKLIAEIREVLSRLNIVEVNHVKSHINRATKGQLPDMTFHEMADRMASQAIRRRDLVVKRLMTHGSVDKECLVCQHFPCKDRSKLTRSYKISNHKVCDDWDPWRMSLVKNFKAKSIIEV